MTTEVINIQIREDGSRVVSKNIAGIGNAADKAERQVFSLKGILASVGAGATITALVRMMDTYTNLQNRLRLVTKDTANLASVTKELLDISNETRSDFAATAELYGRMASSAKDLGLSQQQLLGFTKSLNQAIILSGASAEEAAGGLRQLSQGIASGTLRGDELNSVMENFPKVADVIAESMGKSRGELRKLGAEGKITATDIIDAFAKASDQLDADFAKTVPTISQSFTVLKNNLLSIVGELDKSLGISATFSRLILEAAENLKVLLSLLSAVAVATAVAFAPTIVAAFTAQIRILWATISAHPIGALVTILAGVITYLVLMRDEIKTGIDRITTLGDLMRAVWEQMVPILETVVGVLQQTWYNFTIYFEQSLGQISKSFGDTFSDITKSNESTWLKIVRVIARTIDIILGMFMGLYDGVVRVFDTIATNVAATFSNLGSAKDKLLGGDIMGAIADVDKNNEVWKKGLDIGQNFRDGLDAGFSALKEGGLESRLDDALERAQEIAKDRLAAGMQWITPNPPGVAKPKPPEVDKNAARELERLKSALRSLRDEVDPVGAAMRKLEDTQKMLTQAVKAHLVTQAEANNLYDAMKEKLKDQLDPLGALNREIDRNIELLKMGAGQRQIEAQLYEEVNRLKEQGKKLTAEETAELRAKLVVEQELARIAQIRDSMAADTGASKMMEFTDQLTALKQLMTDEAFVAGDTVGALQKMLPWADLSQTQLQMDAYAQMHADMYAQIQALVQADVINHQTAQMMKAQADAIYYEQKIQRERSFFATLASLSTSGNRKLAAIGKAAAITTAVIDGVVAIQKAWASAPYPYNLPAVAATTVAQAANVAAITSQAIGFRTGGEFTVGGSGGVDSQMVQFRASPGEKVRINTPAQARALEKGGQAQPSRPAKVIVVASMEEAMREYTQSPEFETTIVNLNSRNQEG